MSSWKSKGDTTRERPTEASMLWFECVPQGSLTGSSAPEFAVMGDGGTFRRWSLPVGDHCTVSTRKTPVNSQESKSLQGRSFHALLSSCAASFFPTPSMRYNAVMEPSSEAKQVEAPHLELPPPKL